MREKFERWEFSTDEEKLVYEKTLMIPESEEIQASLNTARNLRAHFENLQKEPPKVEKPRIKVNRFVWWSQQERQGHLLFLYINSYIYVVLSSFLCGWQT